MATNLPEGHVIPGQEATYAELQTFLETRRAERRAQKDTKPIADPSLIGTGIKLVPAQEIARKQRINTPQYRIEHVHLD